MKISLKGGVWKNSEDEILKAAVMKYGLNNWSRVASLMVRKSAKQCKARWYEWLDPTVKKIEWSRKEDEMLLHAAKLFPTQWRTIAQVVGRTAHQCLEHFEFLLDESQGRDVDDANDPRKLRPGELEPNPESKPSRADAVDMDDDEREMLAEARARLANTRGKKAKRKAREKQLESARRMATLQKRRELKAAGLTPPVIRQKRQTIDYGREIPFEQPPPIGYHAVGDEERPEVSMNYKNIRLQHLEGERRAEEEKRLREGDKRKLKLLQKTDLPAALKLEEQFEKKMVRKRGRLDLPDAHLSENELIGIVKGGTASLTRDGGLTPMTPSGYTPGSMSVLPGASTPNQTPGITPGGPGGATPGGTTPGGVTPGATPGGATPSGYSVTSTQAGVAQEKLDLIRLHALTQIQSIQKPSNEIEVDLPDVPDMPRRPEDDFIEDVEILERTEAKRRRLEEAEEWKKESAAVQRHLPRPLFILESVAKAEAQEEAKGDPSAQARILINQTLAVMHTRDAVRHPMMKGLKLPPVVRELEPVSADVLDYARALISTEQERMSQSVFQGSTTEEKEGMFATSWHNNLDKYGLDPDSRSFVRIDKLNVAQRIDQYSAYHKHLRQVLAREAAKAKKLEEKYNLLTAGYIKKCEKIKGAIDGNWSKLEAVEMDLLREEIKETHF